MFFRNRKKTKKNEKRPVKLNITETAFLKTVGLIESFDGEVGWHGVAKRINGNSFEIEDVLVYPHAATEVSVVPDQFEYTKWLYTLPDGVFENLKMHGHSHANFGVCPSDIDADFRKGITGQLRDGMFYIFLIWNKEYKSHIVIYDESTRQIYRDNRIDLTVTFNGKKRPLAKYTAEKIRRIALSDEIKAFLQETLGIVRVESKGVDSA